MSKGTSYHVEVWICRWSPFDKNVRVFVLSYLGERKPDAAVAHVLKALRTALRATFLRRSSERSPNAYVKVRRLQAQRVLKKGDGPANRSGISHRDAAIKSRVGESRIPGVPTL